MKIEDMIGRHREAVLSKWHQSIVESYPNGAGKFLTQNKNKFSNPVGYAINNSLIPILESIEKMNLDDNAEKALDDLIRIRAVQDFSPYDALSFIFSLKSIINKEISSYINTQSDFAEFLKLDKFFDQIIEFSFNLYVQLREKIHSIKANETKKGFERMIERLNKKYEDLT